MRAASAENHADSCETASGFLESLIPIPNPLCCSRPTASPRRKRIRSPEYTVKITADHTERHQTATSTNPARVHLRDS